MKKKIEINLFLKKSFTLLKFTVTRHYIGHFILYRVLVFSDNIE